MVNLDHALKQAWAKYEIYQVALVAFTIYGVVCKFLLSLNLSLNSDLIVPGFLSMEMWRNGNYLLKGIHLNSMDSQLFSDVFLFHLVPQILAGFSPDVLRITGFVIYMAIIVVCSYIVFAVTKNRTNTLVFAALMANIEPLSYSYFEAPMSHIATILFSCVFILVLSVNRYGLASINFNNRRSLVSATILLIIIFLFTFSDLMFAVFFTFPFTVCYILLYGKKSNHSNLFVALMALSSAIAYIFSRFLVNALGLAYFGTLPFSLAGVGKVVLVNIPLYFKGLLLLVSSNLYYGINDVSKFGYVELLTVVLFLAVVFFTVKNIINDDAGYRKFLLAFFVVSSAAVLIPYFFTTLCVNIHTTRYLTFTALLLFLLISIYFNDKNKAFATSIILILVIFSLANFNVVKSLDYQPNKAEYGLISYLKQNDLTSGYGGYWDSNIITYLSGGDVAVRAVNVSADGLRPVTLHSADKWYEDKPGTYFLLIRQDRKDLVNASSFLIKEHPPGSTQQSSGYIIYVFNDSENGKIIRV